MQTVIMMNEIMARFPDLSFQKSHRFVWSPTQATVYYLDEGPSRQNRLALLHEIGHAQLGHKHYDSDIHLLGMEVDAWSYARQQAADFDIEVDDEHVENCLESYRIWLYKRSLCPNCQFHGVQINLTSYRCFMCRHKWKVARSLSLHPQRMDTEALGNFKPFNN